MDPIWQPHHKNSPSILLLWVHHQLHHSVKLRQLLGSVKDQATIGKAMMYNHGGKGFSDIEIAMVRATRHDFSPVDDKYMREILFHVSNSPGSVSFLAQRISHRLGKTRDHLVALKTLLLIHRLMRGGNRYFEQQLRNAHVSGHLQMDNHWFTRNLDRLSRFLQKYAFYLDERMGWLINQAGKLEPVVCQGLELRSYKEKAMDLAFHKLPRCEDFINRVLDVSLLFDVFPCEKLVQAAIMNTLKESFQVYMIFCEGVAALVNMFFDLSKPARALAWEILKKAAKQSQELHDLYENCRRIIRNKNLDYPSVQIINMEHVIALERCLTSSVMNSLTKSAELQVAVTAEKGRKDNKENNGVRDSTNLFSCELETKISKVWVVFEDEDFNAKSGPFNDSIADPPASIHQKPAGAIPNNREIEQYDHLNPFIT